MVWYPEDKVAPRSPAGRRGIASSPCWKTRRRLVATFLCRKARQHLVASFPCGKTRRHLVPTRGDPDFDDIAQ
ncbi:hypothetical protein BHE74_00008874 [Ensete ventricosum]|nr:hypothetical protein BHE74_00008874 [Ensete ventricosum]